jgi:protein-tyrosine-phosphatase
MGEVLLRDRLARAGIAAQLSSAGLLPPGAPAEKSTIRAMAQRGLDLSGHRSSTLTAMRVSNADLIIGMAREHVREVVVLDPMAFLRSFTLRELVRRGTEAGPRLSGPDGEEELSAWLLRVGEGRQPTDVLGISTEDDIADPMGMSRKFHERCAAEIAGLVDQLMELAFFTVDRPSYSS